MVGKIGISSFTKFSAEDVLPVASSATPVSSRRRLRGMQSKFGQARCIPRIHPRRDNPLGTASQSV